MAGLLKIEINLLRKENGDIVYILSDGESSRTFPKDEFLEVLSQKLKNFHRLVRNPYVIEYLQQHYPLIRIYDNVDVCEEIVNALELAKFADWLAEKLQKKAHLHETEHLKDTF